MTAPELETMLRELTLEEISHSSSKETAKAIGIDPMTLRGFMHGCEISLATLKKLLSHFSINLRPIKEKIRHV